MHTLVGSDDLLRWLSRLPPWAYALPLLLLVAVGVRLGLRLARSVLVRRAARARRLGRAGTERALEVLRSAGYRVLATEAVREGVLEVDGRVERFTVRADALVERRGRVYVAEAKGGPESSRVLSRETRRQILEYEHVFGAEGVLLVDARQGTIRVVRFPHVP